jgi:hypothetical protein
MNVYWLRAFWFGEEWYSDGVQHADYLTVRFADRPNIFAQVWLNIFAPGGSYAGRSVTGLGLAAAGFKGYTYIDDEGVQQEQIYDYWVGSVRVERIVDLTVALHVQHALAKADGMIYYWE